MNITFYETKPWEEKYIAKALKGHRLKFVSDIVDDNNLNINSDIVSVFIHSPVDKKKIRRLKRLKMIATRSTGFDHIDVKAMGKRVVSNVPFYGENTVAEHTFGLILSISRNIHKSYVRTQNNNFSIDGLTGFDLKNKTIGIVGGGHIGLHVARMARAFGMHVRVFDIRHDNFLSEVINYQYLPLDDLLKSSDIITLHAPLNPHTKHLINMDNIKLVKKGAIIINTARGGLIDTSALHWALKKKRISGAGLDVIEGEDMLYDSLPNACSIDTESQLCSDHEILRMENVVYTPHNAFNSQEALVRILDTTIENIQAFLDGKPKNQVN